MHDRERCRGITTNARKGRSSSQLSDIVSIHHRAPQRNALNPAAAEFNEALTTHARIRSQKKRKEIKG
jgi:hypothetical protein